VNLVGHAAHEPHVGTVAGGLQAQLSRQARLANAGLTAEQQTFARRTPPRLPPRAQQVEFGGAPLQRGLSANGQVVVGAALA